MADTRRYVVHGRMPLRRTSTSGLFITHFKEDAFFLELGERGLLFNSGARTEQSLQLPYSFIKDGYHMRKRMVESVGFVGGEGRLELYIQYALLPILDNANLEKLRETVLERVRSARPDQQTLLDSLMLEWCDEPILHFEYDRLETRLRLIARAPVPESLPPSARTKKGRLNFYHDYEDRLCSKAAAYVVRAFEVLPPLQKVELNLVRMEDEPIHGLTLVEDGPVARTDSGLRRFDPTTLPPPETAQERKARQKATQDEARAQEKAQKSSKKEEKLLTLTQRETDAADSLFDGRLPHQSPLLSARIPRQGFMDLQRSKQSYSPRKALEMFELRLDTDEEMTAFREIEPYFNP